MRHSGLLKMRGNEWLVCYWNGACNLNFPVFPDDSKKLNSNKSLLRDGDTVDFEMIDEFTHPELYTDIGWGDGIQYAKL